MRRLLPHDYASRAPIERRCQRVWQCGPRTFSHFLDEIAFEHDIADAITAKLEQYCRLNAGIVAALGGDRFAHPPTRIVGGEP